MNKEDIILNYSKGEFERFLEDDHTGKILELLDDEGLKILDKCSQRADRINYILFFSEYREEIFSNPKFLDIFFKTDLITYYANIRLLKKETCINLYKKSVELNKKSYSLFRNYDLDVKLEILDNWSYPSSLLYQILQSDTLEIKQKILDNFNIDLTNLELESFFENCREQYLSARSHGKPVLTMKSTLITNEVIDYIWSKYDIFTIRKIIDDSQYITDSEAFNNRIKLFEENIIEKTIEGMIGSLDTILSLYERYDKEQNDMDKYEILDVINRLTYTNIYSPDSYQLERAYQKNKCQGVKKLLEFHSNKLISNYIIDYIFEDNYHNVMIDLNELMTFIDNGNIVISQDRVNLYKRILEIDNLTNKEKIELFNELKNINMQEFFYDDIREAKNIIGRKIKEQSITKDTLSKYKNEQLSQMYGVDVYTGDLPFYGIVKTYRRKHNMPTGHSFSLVGNNNPYAYQQGAKTVLYDASKLKPEQLVHVYPMDSFTLYSPFSYTEKPSTRVYTLMTPEELDNNSPGYNEILILEQGEEETELDPFIPELEQLAVYCVDEITPEQLEEAKSKNLPIFLTFTKDIKKELDPKRQDIDYWNYDYYNPSEKELFEAKRRK